MRLFTGISLTPEVTGRLIAVTGKLRPLARINWSPGENLHITCKFIGEWPEEGLAEVKAALGGVEATGPLAIRLAGFGFFPNSRHPHSLFAEVHAGAELTALAAAADRALAPLGCRAETRPYRPHVTLARIKPAADIGPLRTAVSGMSGTDFGRFDATCFHLYLSKPGPRGSVYSKLATYDLRREKDNIS